VPFATFQLHSPKADVERTFDHRGFVPEVGHEAIKVLDLDRDRAAGGVSRSISPLAARSVSPA
jgi:hypothetical protein